MMDHVQGNGQINFLAMFIINVGILWLFLLVVYLYQSSRSILKKKGYNEEYIGFIRKDSLQRFLGITIVVPLLELFAALIVRLIVGELRTEKHLAYVMLVFFLCVIPFPVMDAKHTRKKYKELAIKTKSEVLVDLNFQTLHLVFKPAIEIIAGIFYLLYFIVFLQPFHPAMIHLAILWLLYSSVRFARHWVRPLLKDGYLFTFVFLVVNHLLLLYHLAREILVANQPGHPHMDSLANFLGGMLATFLAAKLVYYLANFPRFKREISGKA
jgi:hypothetical protein